MSTFIFLWLQNQSFYKTLQKSVLHPIKPTKENKQWADIGCSTGLMSRLAQKLGYRVVGYDINVFSLFIANILSIALKNIHYENQDFTTLIQKYDVVSATSLLSVVDDKKASLNTLIALLKDEKSTLIIIEPTEHMSSTNVHALINDFKSWWYYKGLLLWANAREGKSIHISLYNNLENMQINHKYYLSSMVRVTYIQKNQTYLAEFKPRG